MVTKEQNKIDFRSGFIALIGRPNVGKSTLVNQLIGEKVAITSPIAQTTRNRLKAILTTTKAQLIIVDTPGIHKPHHLLGERLVNSAKSTIGQVDVVLLILESCYPPGKGDQFIIKLLQKQNIPIVVALNKWDLVKIDNHFQRELEYRKLFEDYSWPFFRCSAKNGLGCDSIIEKLTTLLPNGPCLYPKEMVSDQPQKLLMEELIREQVLLLTKEEIPHSVAINIERIEKIPTSKQNDTKKLRTAILATILVERKSQKGILIGKQGAMLKAIGTGARLQIQTLIYGQVHLELFVKVDPDWRSKPQRLKELGYKEI